MKDKRFFNLTRFILMLVFSVLSMSLWGTVVCKAESDATLEQEVEATYYINETGGSSTYISKDQCTLVGEGTISFASDIDKFELRNNSEEVQQHLVEIPDCSEFLQEGEEIKWVTIYRSHLLYYVIGEKVNTSGSSEETDSNEDSNGDDEFLEVIGGEPLEPVIRGSGSPAEEAEPTPEEKEKAIQQKLENAKKRILEDESLGIDEYQLEALDLGSLDLENLDEDGIVEGIKAIIKASGSTKTYNTYANMVSSKIANGTTVTTKGYYKAGDGGGCTYTISNTKGAVWVRLPNNLFANVVVKSTMTPQQFGAVGDGSADDSEAFLQMAKAGVTTIKIPNGTYDFNSQMVKFNNHVSIIGNSKANCIFRNVAITAPYGLTVKNLTCESGGLRDVWTPGIKHTTRCMFVVTPEGEQTVEYYNCIFKNAGFVSVASTDTGCLASDTATSCEFRNISIAAIFHSCNTKNSVYKENTFVDIGDKNALTGNIAAIWIGDVANIYHSTAAYCEINHNKFYNLYTGDDFSGANHVITGNFLAIKADKALITKNTIKELKGFGNDREAIYTKVTDLEVSGNTIINGGTGEGYICNKSTDGNMKCTVSGNTIEGDYGTGIRQYGTAKITGNKITISHCIAAISHTARSNQTGDWPMLVSENIINCGAGSAYKYKGHTYSDYSSGNLIKLINPINAVTVSKNEVNPTSNYASYISVANAMKDVNIDGNIVNALGRSGNGILVYTKTSAGVSLTQTIKLNSNNVSVGAGGKAITLSFTEPNSKRKIEFKKNITNFKAGAKTNYPLTISSGAKNNDTLVISGNSSNCDKSLLIISVPTKNITNKDENFAKLNIKSN